MGLCYGQIHNKFFQWGLTLDAEFVVYRCQKVGHRTEKVKGNLRFVLPVGEAVFRIVKRLGFL